MTKDLCFWSIGDGDCAVMLQTLVDSFHKAGMTEDFHVFSDQPIEGAITHLVEPFDKRGFFFKFAFLQTEVVKWDYRYFLFLDADTLFVRKPKSIIPLLKGSPLHFFMETPLTRMTRSTHWWNCPVETYVEMMRDCGVTTPEIYSMNAGFNLIKKEAIQTACGLAQDFFEYAQARGFIFPDEPLWNYAMHMLCDNPREHLLKDHFDIWCSDWKGVFADALPTGHPWTFYDYMTDDSHVVDPAIVHVLRSKKLLIEQKNTNHSK